MENKNFAEEKEKAETSTSYIYPDEEGKIPTHAGFLYLFPDDIDYLKGLINNTYIKLFPEIILSGELVPKNEKKLEWLKNTASFWLLSKLEEDNPELRKRLLALPHEKRLEIVYKLVRGERGFKGSFVLYFEEGDKEYLVLEYYPAIVEEDYPEVERLVREEEEKSKV